MNLTDKKKLLAVWVDSIIMLPPWILFVIHLFANVLFLFFLYWGASESFEKASDYVEIWRYAPLFHQIFFPILILVFMFLMLFGSFLVGYIFGFTVAWDGENLLFSRMPFRTVKIKLSTLSGIQIRDLVIKLTDEQGRVRNLYGIHLKVKRLEEFIIRIGGADLLKWNISQMRLGASQDFYMYVIVDINSHKLTSQILMVRAGEQMKFLKVIFFRVIIPVFVLVVVLFGILLLLPMRTRITVIP